MTSNIDADYAPSIKPTWRIALRRNIASDVDKYYVPSINPTLHIGLRRTLPDRTLITLVVRMAVTQYSVL